MTKRAFISHTTEEAPVASRLKAALTQDFLGFRDVFVSSDTEGIGAGEDWLGAVDRALRESSMVLITVQPRLDSPPVDQLRGWGSVDARRPAHPDMPGGPHHVTCRCRYPYARGWPSGMPKVSADSTGG